MDTRIVIAHLKIQSKNLAADLKATNDLIDILESDRNSDFTPPTLSELQAFIFDNNFQVEAQKFLNFYEARKWYTGKVPMQDWKKVVSNWHEDYCKRNHIPINPIQNTSNDDCPFTPEELASVMHSM